MKRKRFSVEQIVAVLKQAECGALRLDSSVINDGRYSIDCQRARLLPTRLHDWGQWPTRHGEDACGDEPDAGQCVRRCDRNARPRTRDQRMMSPPSTEMD